MIRGLGGVLLLLLAGCGEKTVSAPTPEPVRGWRPAGLEAPARGEGDSTWSRIAVSGERLIVLGMEGDIWLSTRASSGWHRFSWTNLGVPMEIAVSGSDTLWVGTANPGRMYRCQLGSGACENMRFPIADSIAVNFVGEAHGHLLARATSPDRSYMGYFDGVGWVDWGQGYPRSTPYRVLTVGDTVWSASWESGLWFRVWGEPSWKKMPAPSFTWAQKALPSDTASHPRALAWHRGSLWVGDWSMEVTEMPGGKSPYRAVRNCPPERACYRDVPVHVFAAAEAQGRLIIAGYFGASGSVLDDSSRQWIPMEDGWCWNDARDCGGTTPRDLVVLGDTLYAASSRFVMKYPLSELPVATRELALRWGWPLDTTWRDTFLNIPNPRYP